MIGPASFTDISLAGGTGSRSFIDNLGAITDALGKTIVCSQAIWMVIQCISRNASGLPVTLLELHTAMHVICALVMYLFWWDKPQDIAEPVVLLEDIPESCLYALEAAGMIVELDGQQGENQVNKHTPSLSELIIHKAITPPSQEETSPTRVAHARPLKGEKESQKPDKQIDLSENAKFLFDIRTKGSLIVNKVLKVTRHNEHNDTMIGKSELNILFEIAARFKAGLPSVLKVVSVTGGSQFESSPSGWWEVPKTY